MAINFCSNEKKNRFKLLKHRFNTEMEHFAKQSEIHYILINVVIYLNFKPLRVWELFYQMA